MKLVTDSFFDQGVEADARSLGGRCGLGVQRGRDTHHELAAGLFFWRDAVFGASLKKKVQRSAKLAAELVWCSTVKVGATVQALNLAAKLVGLRVVANYGSVAVQFHRIHRHGVTPFCSSQSRSAATAPLSMFGDGCGLCSTRTSPNTTTPTREPSRLVLMDAPNSTRSETASQNLTLADTGR